MILTEKHCSRNTLNVDFDCPLKAGVYCGTTGNYFSRTPMLHL